MAGGLCALRLLHPSARALVARGIEAMPFATQHAIAQRAIAFVTRLSPARIEGLAVVAFLYAALFIVEGTGLWTRKVWAEWLTIIATTSFIPFEVYELIKKPTAIRIFVVAANMAIVIYLLVRRRRLK